MVTTFYPPYHFGGDGTYVRSLSRELVARGHQVDVVHCEDAYRIVADGKPVEGPAKVDGVTVHRLRSRLGFLSPLISHQTGHPGLKTAKLKRLLKRPFDVVHFHNTSLIGAPSVLRYSHAPVTLYTLHEHWLLCPMHIFWKDNKRVCDKPECIRCCIRSKRPPQFWRYTGALKRHIQGVDALLSPSDYTAGLHRESEFQVPIHVLPLFSAIEPDQVQTYQAPSRPRFLYVGRITAPKGVAGLVEQFSHLPDYDLWVVGGGIQLQSLQEKYAHLPNIRFLGKLPQKQLAELYPHATALILPTLVPETFGLSIVEAFACGTPVIARDIGASRELIERTGAGFVYSDDAQLVEIATRLATDATLREDLGTRAHQGYRRFYTTQRHVDAYLEHIETIRDSKLTEVG